MNFRDYKRLKKQLLEVQQILANVGGTYAPAHDAIDNAIDELETGWELADWNDDDPHKETQS